MEQKQLRALLDDVAEEKVKLIKIFWYDGPVYADDNHNYIDSLCENLGVPSENIPLEILASNTFTVVRDLWVYLAHIDLFPYVQKRHSDVFKTDITEEYIVDHWFKNKMSLFRMVLPTKTGCPIS